MVDAPRIAAVEVVTVTLFANAALVVHGARGAHEDLLFVLVCVSIDIGVSGYGEISAMLLWSGEDDVIVMYYVRGLLRDALVGQLLDSVLVLSLCMDCVLVGNLFIKVGVNMVLWDVFGCGAGLLVVQLFGGLFCDRVLIKMLLSGDGDALVGSLVAVCERGVGAFKVKVGLGLLGDVECFALVCELVGEDMFFGVDVNGGWMCIDVACAIGALVELGVVFVEQLFALGDVDGFVGFCGFGLLIVVDELVFLFDDVVRVVRADVADVVSVYVGKSGGLDRVLLVMRSFVVFGVGSLFGFNGEMGLGAVVQLHVVCACECLLDFLLDIIGQLYYDQDMLRELVWIDGRHVYLLFGLGFGVEFVFEIVERFA